MWFKQFKYYQFKASIAYDADSLAQKLEDYCFEPSIPSVPGSHGFVSPFGTESAALVHAANGYMMICLQFEEKVLPAQVVKQEVDARVKEIQAQQDRKVRSKERQSIKGEITFALLAKAFRKTTCVHAYIDTHNQTLLINSTNNKKIEDFIFILKQSLNCDLAQPHTKRIPSLMTQWIINNTYPNNFGIEKACVLQDPQQQSRVIRCQQQDPFSSSIQSLIKDGCEVIQLALNWEDRIQFVLTEDFSFKSIRFQDEIIAMAKDNYSETPEQQFDADFVIMTETFKQLLVSFLPHFEKNNESAILEPEAEAATV